MEMVRVTCEAQVGGETVTAQMVVTQHIYDDPEARRSMERHLRMELICEIAERFPPKISAERVSGSPWREV